MKENALSPLALCCRSQKPGSVEAVWPVERPTDLPDPRVCLRALKRYRAVARANLVPIPVPRIVNFEDAHKHNIFCLQKTRLAADKRWPVHANLTVRGGVCGGVDTNRLCRELSHDLRHDPPEVRAELVSVVPLGKTVTVDELVGAEGLTGAVLMAEELPGCRAQAWQSPSGTRSDPTEKRR